MRPTSLHLLILLLAFSGAIIAGCLQVAPCHAAELSISGNSAGQGLHTLSFSGEHLNASIVQGNNGTWLINATGAA